MEINRNRLSFFRGHRVTDEECRQALERHLRYQDAKRELRAIIRWRPIVEGRETEPDYGLWRPKNLKKTATGWTLLPRRT